MKNNIKKGNLVSFYNAGYTGRVINEDGEMEVWDWHIYSSGRVLTPHENSSLVFLYSNIDEHLRDDRNIILDEVSIVWISNKFLSNVSETGY